MRSIVFLFFVILNYCFISCQGEKKEDKNITVEKEIYAADTLFIPGKGQAFKSENGLSFYSYTGKCNENEKINGLVLILDPHGEAEKVCKTYHNLADKYHLILLGIRDLKNGLTAELSRELRDKTMEFLSQSGILIRYDCFLAGFSGGARNALSVQKEHPTFFKSMVLAGAGLNAAGEAHIPVIFMSGLLDMNYVEMLNSAILLENQTSIPYIYYEYKAIHEWPDTSKMNLAFRFLLNMVSKPKNDYQNQLKIWNNIQDDNLDNSDIFTRTAILKSTGKTLNERDLTNYRNALQNRKVKNDLEMNLRNVLGSMIMQEKLADIKKFIGFLPQEIKDDNMVDRLKSYGSLVSYSVCTNLYRNQQADPGNIAEIYFYLDPTNPEASYFMAISSAMRRDGNKTKEWLKKSIKLGFTDTLRLENEKVFIAELGKEGVQSLFRGR